jgi:hypothetical protein
MAKASGLPLSQQELDRVAGPLEDLDGAFRQLVRDLSPDLEPATEFRIEEPSE